MDRKDVKFILSIVIQIPVWLTGLYWGIYWMFNWLLGTHSHPAESPLTGIGGTIICILLVYGIVWFIYGFMAYSFDLPKPFCKKT